jgi:hypothetical protein
VGSLKVDTFTDICDRRPLTGTELNSMEKNDALINENNPVSEGEQRKRQPQDQSECQVLKCNHPVQLLMILN